MMNYSSYVEGGARGHLCKVLLNLIAEPAINKLQDTPAHIFWKYLYIQLACRLITSPNFSNPAEVE